MRLRAEPGISAHGLNIPDGIRTSRSDCIAKERLNLPAACMSPCNTRGHAGGYREIFSTTRFETLRNIKRTWSAIRHSQRRRCLSKASEVGVALCGSRLRGVSSRTSFCAEDFWMAIEARCFREIGRAHV